MVVNRFTAALQQVAHFERPEGYRDSVTRFRDEPEEIDSELGSSDETSYKVPLQPNTALPLTIESMILEMSKAMSQIRVLIQQRVAERVAASVPETTNSAVSECVICRDPLYSNLSCTTMCGHVLHVACMHQLKEYRGRNTIACPVCRENVLLGELIVLRTGLPEAPTTKASDSAQTDEVDLTMQKSEEQRSKLDHVLAETLKSFDHLLKEKKVFRNSADAVKRKAKKEVERIRSETEKSRLEYLSHVVKLKEEREKVQNMISSIAVREEKLEASQEQYNRSMMDVAKKSSDLNIREEKLKAEKKEVEEKAKDFESKLEEVKDKERRLERLRHALDVKTKAMERKRSVSYVDDSKVTKRRKSQSHKSDSRNSQDSPFPEALRLPSAVNRPPAVRRPAAKTSMNPSCTLSFFVPKRPGINRPSASVAKRKQGQTKFC